MSIHHNILRWFDTEAQSDQLDATNTRFNVVRCLPFLVMHLGALAAFWVGVSLFDVLFALGFYWFRMFAVTAFYHRYFAHRTFRTNRFWQFLFAVAGNSAAQRGPLWWAAHHRHHHQHSDDPNDLHSPNRGFWFSHMGWFTCDAGFITHERRIRDWMKYPELRWLNRFDSAVPLLSIVLIFCLGEALARWAPSMGTHGLQLVVWGFFVSTVVLFHCTVSINSLSHLWGSRRFDTGDDSRNNGFLALITLGEGWHNNHHRWPQSARQGFFWWEIDITYAGLWCLQQLGIIHELKPVPAHIREEARAHRRERRLAS